MKIANKISLSFLTVVVLFAAGSALFFYLIARENLERTTYEALKLTSKSRAEHIKTYLGMLKVGVDQLSKSVVLENFLKSKNDKAAFEIAMARIQRTCAANPTVYEFLLMDENGVIVASNNKNNIGNDRSDDAIFLGARKSTYIKDAYYSDLLKGPLIAVSSPVADSKTGAFLGVLAARVTLNDLYRITTEKTGLGATGEIYVVNKYGYMITPSRFLNGTFLKQSVDTRNFSDCMLHRSGQLRDAENEPVILCRDYRRVAVLGTHVYLPEMQWAILTEIETKEAFEFLREIRILFILVLCLIVLAAWLIGVFLGRAITGPIQKLRIGSEIIGAGNLDHKVATKSSDEIGQLSRAFDAMTENLKHSTASIQMLNKEIERRKKLELKLAAVAQEWETTFDSISDLISIQSSKDNTLIKVNKAYAKRFNMDPMDIVGTKCHATVHGTSEPCLNCPHQDTVKTKKASRLEYFEKRLDSFFEVSTYPIFDAANEVTATVHVVKDITRRKKAEEAAKEAAEAKSRFTSMVSHELRTPLTAIKESIALVLDGTTGPVNEEQKNFLEMSKRNVDRLARLINDVLEYQKLESGKFTFNIEEYDLNDVIKEVHGTMTTVAKNKGLDITMDLDYDLPKLKFDRDKIIQVLTNLLNNAIKFTEKGSVGIISKRKGNIAQVTVKDTGPGIGKEDVSKLFTAFEQLDKGKERRTGGTGLGLVISKEIVEKHKGRICVDSELGKGAEFHILLPISEKGGIVS